VGYGMSAKQSLYDKIGGFSAVSGIVLDFYDKVLESELVSPYFSSVDMARLIEHQTQFICALLGGPSGLSDEYIRHVHRNLEISPEAFEQTLQLFRDSLSETDLEEPDVEQVIALFSAKRPLVVQA
jgi:hemoglobin